MYLNLSIYLSIYIYIYICIHISIYVYIYIYMYVLYRPGSMVVVLGQGTRRFFSQVRVWCWEVGVQNSKPNGHRTGVRSVG